MRKAITYETLFFALPEQWEEWLAKNHMSSNGVLLLFYKKATKIPSLNYAQALDVALCYGWIDGQSKNVDEKSWHQKFTPRRARSMWSKRNIEHVKRLIKAEKMQTAGFAQIEAAKADGRWQQAYDSPANMEAPKDLLDELEKNPKAKAFYATLNKTNTYAIAWRLQTAKKPETRARRMQVILEMLNNGEKFH